MFRHSRAATCNSVVSGQIWPEFDLIQALMHVPITCKYQKDRIQNNQEKVETPFHALLVFGGYRLDVQGQKTPIWPKFELLLDIMHILDTYKFKMNTITSNREKVAT